MIYFRKNGEVIEKYIVNFNKEVVEELKNMIIDQCSFIKHEEYESDYSPIFTNKIIRNFTSTPTGNVKEYFEEIRDINLYSYDEYKPPYLVKLIDQLLNGNSDAIDKILNYDISNKSTIDDKINLINQEFNKITLKNIDKKKEKLKELEELLKEKELNKGQKRIELYYNQLIKLIKFSLIDSISISELNKIESFLEDNNSKEKTFIKSLRKN